MVVESWPVRVEEKEKGDERVLGSCIFLSPVRASSFLLRGVVLYIDRSDGDGKRHALSGLDHMFVLCSVQ